MGPKWPKMCQKWPKSCKNEKFLTFENGPKWIKVTFKWSKMAPERIFGSFTPVLGTFWPVPPSFLGRSGGP